MDCRHVWITTRELDVSGLRPSHRWFKAICPLDKTYLRQKSVDDCCYFVSWAYFCPKCGYQYTTHVKEELQYD